MCKVLTSTAEPHGARVGIDPVDRVFLVENHDEAYRVWLNAGVRDRILVHIDAHHDMWWADDKDLITIANFICPALKEGIVRELYWVVPDETLTAKAGRKAVQRHVGAIVKRYPQSSPGIWQNGQLCAAVLGRRFVVCSVSALPTIKECVLLDVDTDFMVIPRVSWSAISEVDVDEHSAVPWCWPRQLLDTLSARDLRTDLVTIAYSVEGGYTPVKWKHLADELALLFRGSSEGESLRAMSRMREGVIAAHQGQLQVAEQKYAEAHQLSPQSPAPLHHLATLYLDTGRIAQARAACQQAVALDGSYVQDWLAFRQLWTKQYRAAERAFGRMAALNADNPYALFGLAELARRRRDWHRAEELLRKILAINGEFIDAQRLLGRVLAKMGRVDEAVEMFERSLLLALRGHKPLVNAILTDHEGTRFVDAGHFGVHGELARLYELKGNDAEAIRGYEMSLAGSRMTGAASNTARRLRLARLYMRTRQWRLAGRHLSLAVRTVWQGLRIRRRLQKAKEAGLDFC